MRHLQPPRATPILQPKPAPTPTPEPLPAPPPRPELTELAADTAEPLRLPSATLPLLVPPPVARWTPAVPTPPTDAPAPASATTLQELRPQTAPIEFRRKPLPSAPALAPRPLQKSTPSRCPSVVDGWVQVVQAALAETNWALGAAYCYGPLSCMPLLEIAADRSPQAVHVHDPGTFVASRIGLPRARAGNTRLPSNCERVPKPTRGPYSFVLTGRPDAVALSPLLRPGTILVAPVSVCSQVPRSRTIATCGTFAAVEVT